jgi:ATP-dependent helicase/DNAse subunit B
MESRSVDGFREVMSEWNTALAGISEKILAGNMDIDPINENVACSTCQLKAVCRNGLKSSIAA